jgi:uncharacterized membrane protein SirB2
MSLYLIVKHVHIGSVILSFALFLVRGGLMFADVGWRKHGLLRSGRMSSTRYCS